MFMLKPYHDECMYMLPGDDELPNLTMFTEFDTLSSFVSQQVLEEANVEIVL